LGFSFNHTPFSFAFKNDKDGSQVISTKGSTFYLSDKFIQMDIELPTTRLFGLGERKHEFLLGQGTWTMWTSGQFTPYDDGTGWKQVYGVHPFLLA